MNPPPVCTLRIFVSYWTSASPAGRWNMVIIEHNLDVIKTADWIVGPGSRRWVGGGQFCNWHTGNRWQRTRLSHRQFLAPLLPPPKSIGQEKQSTSPPQGCVTLQSWRQSVGEMPSLPLSPISGAHKSPAICRARYAVLKGTSEMAQNLSVPRMPNTAPSSMNQE
ncbi:MAG: hypothetical protein CM15mP74_17800 [Halieaceae bacterium]|nr:MAG: hypothetical protein CM15mP74_17800 [Halieaceae bacterium]